MSRPRPFGQNYQWRVSSDTNYRPRGLNAENHAALVIAALAQDPEVMSLEKSLGERLIMSAIVGVNTLDLRIYSRKQCEAGVGGIVSRNDDNDRAQYLEFTPNGLVAVEGVLKERARSHSPMFYAVRVLTPRHVAALDGLQLQICGAANVIRVRSEPNPPLQNEEEIVDLYPPADVTLEPTPA